MSGHWTPARRRRYAERVPDWTKATLGERLDYIAKARGVSRNKLAERAGVSSGEISRLAHRPRPSAKRLGQIAKAWDVSLDWLANGEGPPFVQNRLPDRYPNRAVAAEIARAGGVTEAAVSSVLGDQLDGEDRSVLWWIHRMEHREVLQRDG